MYKHADYNTHHYTTNLAISSKIANVNSSEKVKRAENNRRFLSAPIDYIKPIFKSMPTNLVETLSITDQLLDYSNIRGDTIKVTKLYFVKFTHNINFRQTFFKIGFIRNLSHDHIFYRIPNYDCRILALTKELEAEFACVFDQYLNIIIKKYYEKPEILLSPEGDIHCFKFSFVLYTELLNLIKQFS